MMDKVQKQNNVSVNWSHALFSLLTAHDNFAMQALVWLHMVQSGVIQFGVVQFGASFANLRQPHIFMHKISGKNLVLHSSKYSRSLHSQQQQNHEQQARYVRNSCSI
jgi:hypothetical protein